MSVNKNNSLFYDLKLEERMNENGLITLEAPSIETINEHFGTYFVDGSVIKSKVSLAQKPDEEFLLLNGGFLIYKNLRSGTDNSFGIKKGESIPYLIGQKRILTALPFSENYSNSGFFRDYLVQNNPNNIDSLIKKIQNNT
ncbi:MAG: hypothetical protein ACMXX6_00070 [Candidatus Woesearchaeota archaeon]